MRIYPFLSSFAFRLFLFLPFQIKKQQTTDDNRAADKGSHPRHLMQKQKTHQSGQQRRKEHKVRHIGATQKNDGYLSGNGYMVTWAFGHLIQLAMPEAYGVANFRRESLPILPPDFQLIPRQVKAEKGYKADPGVLKQLKVIKEVFDQCDKIIVATDAGREPRRPPRVCAG